MNTAWFWLLAGMFAVYAMLDGYDLGVGAAHLWLARSDADRRQALAAIGPVWNGNEVWLIAAGGMMLVSFPRLYAAAFSGFYLAMMLALWLLILRGIAIEARDRIANPLWRGFWDAVFWLGSGLLALLLGIALGNVVRGVPLGADGDFQGSLAALLNPYALLTGLLSLAVLAWHGLGFARLRCEGAVLERARRGARRMWWAAAGLMAAATAATLGLGIGAAEQFARYPAAWIFPAMSVAGLWRGRPGSADRQGVWGSALAIAGLLGSAAITVYPNLLRSTANQAYSLTIYNAAADRRALIAAFVANSAGLAAVALYVACIHRAFAGKARVESGYGEAAPKA